MILTNNKKNAIFALLLLASVSSWGQAKPATNNAMQIKALKIELEDLRKQRDQIVANRWSLREKASQYRTNFEDKIEVTVLGRDFAQFITNRFDSYDPPSKSYKERLEVIRKAKELQKKSLEHFERL